MNYPDNIELCLSFAELDMTRLPIDDFLAKSTAVPMLDVRSPAEYESGHIPHATSFPLFSNEERAIIGTLYKQQGRQPAIQKGLELVEPKMTGFVEAAEKLGSDTIALYCWRGGMRSESMAWLLEQHGFNTIVLHKGYKAYRGQMLAFFEQNLPLHVITGYTGSKKTELLHLLQEKGEQVVDLEGLAGHQGSSFGNQKSKQQPTTEHFQNLVFEEFRKFDLNRPIWIEDESMHIGQVSLIEPLYHQKNASPHFVIEIEKEQRVDFLVEDYGGLSKEQLIAATTAIRKKLGGDKANLAIDHILAGNLREAATIILTYYDARYHKTISNKEDKIRERFRVDINALPELVDVLIKRRKHVV